MGVVWFACFEVVKSWCVEKTEIGVVVCSGVDRLVFV